MSKAKAARDLPKHWDKERFKVVDAGDGMIALHSPSNNRFISMDEKGSLKSSAPKGANDLPADWKLERFYAVPAKPYLEPGSVVALHSGRHNRFIRMNGLKVESLAHGKDLPKGWKTPLFTVVDAGNGMVGFHNQKANRYMRMNNHKMESSPERDASMHQGNFFRFFALASICCHLSRGV